MRPGVGARGDLVHAAGRAQQRGRRCRRLQGQRGLWAQGPRRPGGGERRVCPARGIALTPVPGPLPCDRRCRVTAPGQKPPKSSRHHGNLSQAAPPCASWHHWAPHEKVSPCQQDEGRGLCPGAHAETPHGSGRWPFLMPQAQQEGGQGARGPKASRAVLSLQAPYGPALPVASGGGTAGGAGAVLSAHALRPPQEPRGLVGRSWAQPHTPQVNQGGEGTLPGLPAQGGRPGPSPDIEAFPELHAAPGVPARAPASPCPRPLSSGQRLPPHTRSQEAGCVFSRSHLLGPDSQRHSSESRQTP